jgi:hypothetical protein
VTENSIELQTAFDLSAALFQTDAVRRGQNVNLVSARNESFDKGLAAKIVRARVVGRVKIYEHKDLHGCSRVGGHRLMSTRDRV